MAHSPTSHARSALVALSEKLASARADETNYANRLSALETELALNAARLEELTTPESGRRRVLLKQRIADLLELRASMIAERAKRRRLIDEMVQRKEAIDAALAVLRDKASPMLAAAP